MSSAGSSSVVAGASTGDPAVTASPEFQATQARLEALLHEEAARRRVEPRDDLISAVVAAEAEGVLDWGGEESFVGFAKDDLVSFAQFILLAGNETTRNAISRGMLALMQHPEQAALLPSQLPITQPARKSRSGLIVSLIVLAVLIGGGAVGYAAYRAADDRRVVVPPLPDATLATPTGTLKVEPLTPDVKPEAPRNPGVSTPSPPKQPTGPKAPATPADTGVSNPGQVVVGSGGGSSTIQLPFPIPSNLQIPTALPSGIQLPPGISFPPGFPGVPQQPTATPPATTPPAPTTAPPAPTTTDKPKASSGTKP